MLLTRLVSVGLLDTTSRDWCDFASGLGGELLARCLTTSGLACWSVLAMMYRDVVVRCERRSGVAQAIATVKDATECAASWRVQDGCDGIKLTGCLLGTGHCR